MIERYRIPILIAVFAVILASILLLNKDKTATPNDTAPLGSSDTGDLTNVIAATDESGPTESSTVTAPTPTVPNNLPHGKELANPSGFINTEPFKLADYIGKKIILVDFWTYSCINCQRTLPYLTAWDRTYRDQGLLIVGVHTPEFEFEKDINNVQTAVQKAGIEYPVVLDNDYATWRAYGNRYWPRKYLIDLNGNIVYDHIGEGAYDEAEQKIREELALLAKKNGTVFTSDMASPQKTEAANNEGPQTPEIYFGAMRNQYLGNGSSGKSGVQTFTAPSSLNLDHFYLSGTWNVMDEYAESQSTSASITLSYQAQKVFMVAHAEKPLRLKVLLDGVPLPENMRGSDVDKEGYLNVSENRLYRVVEGTVWGKHRLDLISEESGLEAFTFTFG